MLELKLRNRAFFYFVLIALLWQHTAFSQSASFQGQLSGWLNANFEKPLVSQLGIRYIPELALEKSINSQFDADALIALNAYANADFYESESTDTQARAKGYRLWGRLASEQFEARVGLQKINFGSATLFRPLRWFDRIDPRDPLQITDGVYGLLTRYYFQNNANIWLWGLYGNDDAKGREIAPTIDNRPEFGGRAQVPLLSGEIALSYHSREADFSQLAIPLPDQPEDTSVPENRMGLDGKWDAVVGLWFEAAMSHHETDISELKYHQELTVGIDYTFDAGNGLYALFEQNFSELSEKAFGSGKGTRFSGLSINYPIGLIDRISAIAFYDWKNKDWYRTFTWQWLYDKWSFFLIGYWNPEVPFQSRDNNNTYSGKGLQLMVVFNH